MDIFIILSLLVGGIGGGIGSYFYITTRNKKNADKVLMDAENKSKDIIIRAEAIATNLRKEIDDARNDIRERKQGAVEQENRLSEKEQKIDKKYEELEGKQNALRQKESSIDDRIAALDHKQMEMGTKLESIAKLSTEEAKTLLLEHTEERYEKDILSLIEKKKKELKNREGDMAREILIKSLQQYAGEVTGETTQTMVQLESDDLKGKIIGKEGRNIIAFEKATGVSLIIDDAPDTVFLSSFDLFRRYIAKKSLEDLILDKRIQPARIEEIVEKNQKDADKLIYDLGRKTIDEMGVIGIPEEIIPLIGKFRFRTSYGQNILMHSKEVAYIAEGIAKLIGADPVLALKGGLLHDLGKAMDHDIEGTHPEIGGRIARKYGLDEKTINIIEGHHDDVPQICIETKIVQIADAISAVRPGARRMNVEDYVKRIQEMENIAMSFPGVNKAYALSAGREVRVFVDADTISDLDAEKRAREIATQIEANCNYPGEVKINLIREKRVIEYAK
ncbi:ribonuclease Y [Candidatus Gracilibacteria bacterium]|nr:ribonuclease Y [Candidatus Gracilibacteria bacterium]